MFVTYDRSWSMTLIKMFGECSRKKIVREVKFYFNLWSCHQVEKKFSEIELPVQGFTIEDTKTVSRIDQTDILVNY